MNEAQNVKGWSFSDPLINAGLNSRRGKTTDELRAECKRLLNINPDYRAATYWDTHLSTAERRVIYKAAGLAIPESAQFGHNGQPLPHGDDFINRPFSTIPKNEQLRLLRAAQRASEWAAALRLN